MTQGSASGPAPRREVSGVAATGTPASPRAATTPPDTTTPSAPVPRATDPSRATSSVAPTTYGTGVRRGSLIGLVLGALLVVAAYALAIPPGIRSVALGTGLVALSSVATVLVAAQMYRVAPAATAPALATLYLLKVLVLGWLLIVVGRPPWLVAAPFLISALTTLVIATVTSATLAHRVSDLEAQRLASASSAEGPARRERG